MAPIAIETSTNNTHYRKKALVVGLGMVGIAFVEKLLKYDLEGGKDEWQVVVVGEEPHIAYNRVGLTTYFEKRNVEDLYLNPLEWYSSHAPGKLVYHTSDPVISIDAPAHTVTTSKGLRLDYDICILATGSDAALPPYVSRERFSQTTGNFVYRNISDLNNMIEYAEERPIKKAAVVGGGLLGLEAAHALLQLETVDQVVLVERNQWVLSRQLDGEGGRMVLDKVRALGVEVLLQARVRDIIVSKPEDDPEGKQRFKGVLLEGDPDEPYELDMIVYAVGISPRDNLAHVSGIKSAPRGGFEVDQNLLTDQPDVYAIGECASFKGETFGIIAPGVEMADVLAFNLTEAQNSSHAMRSLSSFDLSTKLKLMGVDVASFGDFFADKGKLTRPLPGSKRPSRKSGNEDGQPLVKALTYRDPFSDVYKKYLFTPDGKYLVGGMMVGDCKDYVKLVSMCNKGKELEQPPSELIIGASKEGEDDGGDLDDDTQICSCHNITKGAVVHEVKEKGCRSLGEIKSKTKCGTGCGGCMPLATSIFNTAMKEAGAEVTNHLCIHFRYSRQELYTIIKFRKLQEFTTIMKEVGIKPDSLGCEVCRPAIGSILSSLYNEFIMKPQFRQTQDTNDRYLANVQRDGSYSVVPRLPAGEITPAGLKAIGEVAEKFKLHSKITGGQRIDLFGAKKQDLPSIWEMLVDAGFESGHAYGKSLRTVKSCVGSSWCRYGVGDSVGFAVELEMRYRSIRSPHKFKGGVSGCVRECAEAQGKDFGLIATTKGWNVFVGGNGGAKPRHAELIAEDVTRRQAVKILDRYIIYYIRTADKLQRTARWQEAHPGGLKGIKEVIIDDKLGICAELEKEMEVLVGTYHCEWTKVVNDESERKKFRQFVNTDETQAQSEIVMERGQPRPADWSENATPLKFSPKDVAASAVWEFRPVCRLSDLDPQENAPTSAVVKYGDSQIALWNIPGRGLRAAQNMCPHRRAFVLSDGLCGEDAKGRDYISCPLHKRNYVLSHKEQDEPGSCNDADYQIMTFEAKSNDNGDVLVKLPPTDALDAVLSTSKWMIRKAQEESDYLAGQAEEQGYGIEIAGVSSQVEDEAAGKEPTTAYNAGASKKVACGESKLDW